MINLKKCRNAVSSEIKQAKEQHSKNTFRENEGNSRMTWRKINELSSRKIHSSSVKEIKLNNSNISDPQYWTETYQCPPTEWRHYVLCRLS